MSLAQPQPVMVSPRTAHRDDRSNGRTSPWVRWLILIFIVATILRFPFVKRTGLWPDEVFSLAMATGHSIEHSPKIADAGQGDYLQLPYAARAVDYHKYVAHESPPAPPSRVVRAVFESDTSPPLYYLLLYAWTRALGTGDAILRGFSLACALACIPVLWWTARQIGGPRAAIAACTLFAVLPACVYYSVEGRMYSLLWLTSACFLATTVSLRRAGAGWLVLGLWTLSAAAGLLTHYFFAFVLCAVVAWLMWSPKSFARGRLILASVAVAVLVAPWYVRIPATLSHWRVTDNWLTLTPHGFDRFTSSLLLPWSFFSAGNVWGSGGGRFVEATLAVTLGLVAILALWRLRSRLFTGNRAMLWIATLSACAGLVVFDLWRGTYATACPRYAMAGLTAAMLLFGSTLAALRPWLRRTVLAIVCAAMIYSNYALYRDAAHLHPARKVADILSERAGPDDVIVVSSIPSGVSGIARYLRTRPGEEPGFVSWVEQFKQFSVPEDVLRLAKGRKRIILVRMHEVWAEPTHEDWLWRNTYFAEKIQLPDARIDFFEPPDKRERF